MTANTVRAPGLGFRAGAPDGRRSECNSLELLIAGINWPPETFLGRLIDGLTEAGVSVTVGSSNRPKERNNQVKCLPTPSWDSRVPLRLSRLKFWSAESQQRRTHAVRDSRVGEGALEELGEHVLSSEAKMIIAESSATPS